MRYNLLVFKRTKQTKKHTKINKSSKFLNTDVRNCQQTTLWLKNLISLSNFLRSQCNVLHWLRLINCVERRRFAENFIKIFVYIIYLCSSIYEVFYTNETIYLVQRSLLELGNISKRYLNLFIIWILMQNIILIKCIIGNARDGR